ncbi:MAG: hypothetical protein ACI882_003595 [Reinekea sp.]|jgi:hypothetical protein
MCECKAGVTIIKKFLFLLLVSSSIYANEPASKLDSDHVRVIIGTSLADRIEIGLNYVSTDENKNSTLYLTGSTSFYKNILSIPSTIEVELGYTLKPIDWLSAGIAVKKVSYLNQPQPGISINIKPELGKSNRYWLFIKGQKYYSLVDNGGFGEYTTDNYNIKLGIEFKLLR